MQTAAQPPQDTQYRSKSSKAWSMPRIMLSLEGLAVFVTAIILYARYTEADWWLFVLLLLVPDAIMVSYFIDKRVGAVAYNIVHSYSLTLAAALLFVVTGNVTGLTIALIWTAHIGMDRMLGFGLKYITGFNDSHLGSV